MFAKGFGSLHLPVLSKVLFVTKTPRYSFFMQMAEELLQGWFFLRVSLKAAPGCISIPLFQILTGFHIYK